MCYAPYEYILNLTNTSFLRRRHEPYQAVDVLIAWNDVPKNNFLLLSNCMMDDMSAMRKIAEIENAVKLNPFQANVPFPCYNVLYPLKTLEKL